MSTWKRLHGRIEGVKDEEAVALLAGRSTISPSMIADRILSMPGGGGRSAISNTAMIVGRSRGAWKSFQLVWRRQAWGWKTRRVSDLFSTTTWKAMNPPASFPGAAANGSRSMPARRRTNPLRVSLSIRVSQSEADSDSLLQVSP